MARGADISMLGDKGLERMLRGLPAKLQDKAVRFAVRKAAKVAASEAVRRVPVDTGRLKALLAAQKLKTTTVRGLLTIGLPFPSRAELGIEADDEHYWPAALEYGHAAPGGAARTGSGHLAKGRAAAGTVKAVAPRPYARPAIDENRERLIGLIIIVLRKKIPKIAAKLAARR